MTDIFAALIPMLVTYVQAHFYISLGIICDTFGAGEDIVGNYCPGDVLLQQDVRTVLPEFTSANQYGAAFGLYSRTGAVFAAPLDKRAITEADGSGTCYFCDLVAWAPECAIYETNAAGICFFDFYHCRIRPVKRDKFTIGD